MNYLTLPNLARLAVLVAIIKFTFEGLTYGTFTLGHVDASTYTMFLGPILAHNAWNKKGVGGDDNG